jgi:16S rRNA (cytidine1402-2'-O)-methyltransferase
MGERTPQLLRILETGDLALVSEAGTPGLSDPGHELVLAALAAGHEVSAVPGPAAPIAALASSGLPFRQFTFLGFLPRRATARKQLLSTHSNDPATLVFFESPHRIGDALRDALATLGDRRTAVCRELTKVHEEVFRAPLSEAIPHFTEPRGEFTVVIEGVAERVADISDEDLRAELRRLREIGVSARDAATEVARRTGAAKRRVYSLSLELDGPIGQPD